MKGTLLATTIRVRPEIWKALRHLAEEKALADGGKASISAAVEALVERETARAETARAAQEAGAQ